MLKNYDTLIISGGSINGIAALGALQFLHDQKKLSIVLGVSSDIADRFDASHEIKNMLKDLNPRELELARFKINNVLKTMSEDNISEEAIAKIMEIMDTTINELSGGD